VNDFRAGESFDGDYFVRNVLTPIHLLAMVATAHNQKRSVMNADNSPIDKLKVVRAKPSQMPVHVAPYPPHWPELALSGFFLFRCMKKKMLDLEFDSAED
jgi:hypothetical protein